ncbi:MAG: patatin-like phospholipase family protein, partial [Planctomycetota bacterium]
RNRSRSRLFLSAMTLREWLLAQPFDLAMSSGFFGFFAHAGFLTALLEESFAPSRVAGSSAGALVAGFHASGMKPSEMRDHLSELRKSDFWDPFPGPGLVRGRRLRRVLEERLPVARIEDAALPLLISVFDVFAWRTVVLRSGDLARAIHASCCVPGLFWPVWIERRVCVDGGLRDHPGISGFEPGDRVLQHLLLSDESSSAFARARRRTEQNPNTAALVLPGLPKVGPNRLDEGMTAFERAREAALQALDAPVSTEEGRGLWVLQRVRDSGR